jgi:hypothetical protein
MTTARDETWNVDTSVTAGVEMSSEVGAAPFASVSMKVSLSTTIGSGYAETISTSNTYETSKTKIEGETESISATIGEHDESKGIYRYALFGTTDVYCLFTVDPSSREIQAIEVKNLAREPSYAWGIDYHGVGGSFGKTGTGDLFEVPDIDFSEIEAPTDMLEAPPEPPPPPLKTVWSAYKEDQHVIFDYEPKYNDYYDPDLDISRLRDAGYTKITFKLEFQAWEIYDGYANVWVYVNDKEQGKSYGQIDLAPSKWDTRSVTFTIPIAAFKNSSSNTLRVMYDASGNDEDDYRLGNRTVTLTAEK